MWSAALSLLAAATLAGGARAAAPEDACQALTAVHLANVTIASATDRPEGPMAPAPPGRPGFSGSLPAHCQVTGIIDQRTGVGGKPYGIRFEMRLPRDWNGRFLFQGGGGINGFVAPAIGLVKGPPALTRGFAVVSQDAGHEGRDASFGEDQQARLDMEYRSYERVTTVAKQLVADFYGKPPSRSYFMGCSEGGREALLVSQRLPLEYDGVVAGDPGFLLGVSFESNTDRMIIAGISPKTPDGKPDYAKAFSATDLALVEAKVEADCDALDGLKDGMIDNPIACRPRLETLICAGSKADGCLTKAQVLALRAVFEGGRPVGAGGLKSKGFFYDTGIGLPAWKGKLAGFGGLKSDGVGSFQGLFLTPYDPTFDEGVVDFASLGPRLEEVGSLNRADGVSYSSFKQHGGKILIYTGLSDQAFSAKELLDYYQRLGQANGGAQATAAFARVFLVPGMTHCGGGNSLDTFDPLPSLVEWVEHDTAPDRMDATGKAFPGRSRPLCAYPTQSRYKGSGSTDEATNFDCRLADAGH
jgi:feruloyl esterase